MDNFTWLWIDNNYKMFYDRIYQQTCCVLILLTTIQIPGVFVYGFIRPRMYTMSGLDKSFILYEPFKLGTEALFKFRFKTTEQTVLLLYADDKIDSKADRCYVQLGLKDGRLSLMLRMSMKVDQVIYFLFWYTGCPRKNAPFSSNTKGLYEIIYYTLLHDINGAWN